MENVISEICVTQQDDAECVNVVCFRKKTKIISVLRGMKSRQCLKIVYRRQSKSFVKCKCILAFRSVTLLSSDSSFLCKNDKTKIITSEMWWFLSYCYRVFCQSSMLTCWVRMSYDVTIYMTCDVIRDMYRRNAMLTKTLQLQVKSYIGYVVKKSWKCICAGFFKHAGRNHGFIDYLNNQKNSRFVDGKKNTVWWLWE